MVCVYDVHTLLCLEPGHNSFLHIHKVQIPSFFFQGQRRCWKEVGATHPLAPLALLLDKKGTINTEVNGKPAEL